MDLTERLARVKVLVMDVDGVLTDGTIVYGSGNVEIKAFNIKDGLGMKLAVMNGLPIVWLTGRRSDAVARRASELNVQVQQGSTDKDAGLRDIARNMVVALDEIAYVGDDLNDLPALRIAGVPIAVADAAPEVIEAACHVTSNPGGHGAIREVIEMIFNAQDRWSAAITRFLDYTRGETAPPKRV